MQFGSGRCVLSVCVCVATKPFCCAHIEIIIIMSAVMIIHSMWFLMLHQDEPPTPSLRSGPGRGRTWEQGQLLLLWIELRSSGLKG